MTRLKGKAKDRARKKQKNKNKNSYFLRKKSILSKIRKWDDPVLKETCSPVDPTEDISAIVKELKSVLMLSDSGLGIAASQIGYTKRIFVTRPTITSSKITVFVNATIVSEGKEREKRGEGCLSYPGIVAIIERPADIVVAYEDENFKVHEGRYKGLEACVICHEHDHTKGVCLVAEEWRKSLVKDVVPFITGKKDEVISEEVTKKVLEKGEFVDG